MTHHSLDLRVERYRSLLTKSFTIKLFVNVYQLISGLMRVAMIERGGNAMVITKAFRSDESALNFYAVYCIALGVHLDLLMLRLGCCVICRFFNQGKSEFVQLTLPPVLF